MLSVLIEIVISAGLLGSALVWWQHDIDLKGIRTDFEEVRKQLEEAGILTSDEEGDPHEA